MKITTNFAAPWRDLTLVLGGLFWLGATMELGVSGYLWMRGTRLAQARPALAARLAAMQERVAGIDVTGLPSARRLAALHRRIVAVNGLAGVAGWPMTRVLAQMEAAVPRGVVLASLDDKVDVGEITLVAQAPHARALTQLLARLEAVAHFRHVLLVEQHRYRRKGVSWVRCKVRLFEGRA